MQPLSTVNLIAYSYFAIIKTKSFCVSAIVVNSLHNSSKIGIELRMWTIVLQSFVVFNFHSDIQFFLNKGAFMRIFLITLITSFVTQAYCNTNQLILNLSNNVPDIQILKVYTVYQTNGSFLCWKDNDGSGVPKEKLVDYVVTGDAPIAIEKNFYGIACEYQLSEIIVSAYNYHGYITDFASVRVVNEFNYNKFALALDNIDEVIQQNYFNYLCVNNEPNYGCYIENMDITSLAHQQVGIALTPAPNI